MAVGIWVTLPCPAIVEMASMGGYDFVIVDMEHAPLEAMDVEDMARAGQANDISVLARVKNRAADEIGRVLETGVEGILVPRIDSAQDAEEVVRASYFPPRGARGRSGLSRAAGFSFPGQAPGGPFIGVQIESMKAVENAEAILNVKGLDMVFLGPEDLYGSLLIEGADQEGIDRESLLKAALDSAIQKVVDHCRQRRKPVLGAPASYPTLGWNRSVCKEKGTRVVTVGSDISLLSRGMVQRLAEF